jgi:DNA polymerase III epsilon subunit-like protein
MPDLFEETPNICLMRASTMVCKIPGKRGGNFKFPKLSEACAFFKIEQPAAHSAIGDAISAAEILRKLKALGVLPEPLVHYAANKPVPISTAPKKEEAY